MPRAFVHRFLPESRDFRTWFLIGPVGNNYAASGIMDRRRISTWIYKIANLNFCSNFTRLGILG